MAAAETVVWCTRNILLKVNPESGQFVNGLLFFPKNTNEDNIIIKIDEIADPGKPLGGGANWRVGVAL